MSTLRINGSFRLANDSTTQLVLQTIEVYERSAKECLARWSQRRHRRPPLLVEWLRCLPANARLLDLGCGGGQDAVDLGRRGYRVGRGGGGEGGVSLRRGGGGCVSVVRVVGS